MPAHAGRLMRFAISGMLTSLAGYGVYLIGLALGLPYLAASVLSWCLGVSCSFALNKHFTFRDGRRADRAMIVRFMAVYLGQLILGTSTLALLVEIAHLRPVIAFPVNVLITASFSYLLLSGSVFSVRIKAV